MTLEAVFRLRIRPGQDAAFANIAQAITDDAEANEPGTRSCTWLREPGGDRVLLKCSFVDASALATHVERLRGTGHLERLLATCDARGAEISGPLDAEARQAVADFDAVCYNRSVGFVRREPALIA